MRELQKKNVILRVVKPYTEARNHIYTGTVVHCDEGWIGVDGVVFNFGRPTTEDPSGGLTVSPRAIRWLPYGRVQYLRELEEGADPFNPDAFELTEDGRLRFAASDRPDLLPD
jgi:hypothetical protein